MACETLAEFQELAAYRKSLMGDLQIAKSKPVKLVVLEGFKFEKGQKALALVLGAVPTKLMDELKGNAAKVKAAGALALVDNVVKITVKSGKLEDSEMKKALELAQVKREFKVAAAGDEREADENEDEALPGGEPPLPPRLAGAGEAFKAAQRDLEAFFRERSAALQWHESEIRTQQDATRKVAEIKDTIAGLKARIDEAEKKKTDLAKEIKDLRKEEVTKYAKGGLDKLQKAVAAQQAIVDKFNKQIEQHQRKLPELEVLAAKHGSSRHGAQTDVGLQARRATTGGVTPDQADNVHGVSEQRIGADDEPITELDWHTCKVKIQRKDGQIQVINPKEVLKTLITEAAKLDKVDTDTASKFHSHELEREAVQRALAKARECIWAEVLEGEDWKPLEVLTVYLGAPRSAAGWGFSYSRQSAAKMAVDDANRVIERFRSGALNQKQLLDQLNVAMSTVTQTDARGKSHDSVPMVKTARVTLKRSGSSWTSITHFPDPTATPAGWTLTGRFVRKDARSPKITVPAGSIP